MTDTRPTHVAYADETHHNAGRYRAISALSLSVPDAVTAASEAREILQRAKVGELKWAELRTARTRFAAQALLTQALDLACRGVARVDTLVWDVEDSRHKIKNRSDTRNLRRMYYFLFGNTLARRWPEGCVWLLCPDQSSAEPGSHLNYLGSDANWNEEVQ